jgi:diguanylate cyclase (GGDEF)-like protein/PAS domain S-box-containing protein
MGLDVNSGGFGAHFVRLDVSHGLTALAICICGIGCFAFFNLLVQSREMPRREAVIWLAPAVLTFTLTVWSTNFLAMLADRMMMPFGYDGVETLASALVAALGGLLAIRVWYGLPQRRQAAALGGMILGLGIGGMNYLGVAAMRLPGVTIWNPWIIGASFLPGIGFTLLALLYLGDAATIRRRWEAAGLLILAIVGLHYTGMLAMRPAPAPAPAPPPPPGPVIAETALVATPMLAFVVVAVSLTVLLVFVATVLMQQHLAWRAAEAEEERRRLMNSLGREAMIIHRNGVILEVNQAASRMLGRAPELLEGQDLLSLFTSGSTPALLRRMLQGTQEVWPEEMQMIAGDGGPLPVEIACRTIQLQGAPAMVICLRDLSARKQEEARIQYMALHDPLTDLPGRHLLHERLADTLAAAAQRGTGAAVMYLDLNRFKPINDLLGHAGGDAMLVEIARRLRSEVRSADTIARLGGDEFVVVIADIGSPGPISGFARRLIEVVEQEFTFEGRQVSVGVSIGAALYPRDGADADALLRAADVAMYRAKAVGSGVLEFFEPRMDIAIGPDRRLEQELRGALHRHELRLLYQPLVNCRTGAIDGFEALLRWNHPEQGLLTAGNFIPQAEESGLIGQLDHWVIYTACNAAASWSQPARLAVNIAPSEFHYGDLPRIVASALSQSGLDPARLEIEVTESVLVDEPERAIAVLTQLRALGVTLSMGNSGCGRSSLNYLRLFRFDNIKIDSSFLPDLDADDQAATIINKTIELSHRLGLQVTVEGVETAPQLSQALTLSADHAQGYLLGRPDDVESFLGHFGASVRTLIHACGLPLIQTQDEIFLKRPRK